MNFNTEDDLVFAVHKEKHMIENDLAEPFVCEHCGRTFSYKANLKRHERIHTGLSS